MSHAKLIFAMIVLGLLAAPLAASVRADVARERNLLVTSGVAADRAAACSQQLDRLAAEALRKIANAQPAEQIQLLHAFLHERVLRGNYLASASDLCVALDGGPYNCVSATLILCLLAERCGLEAWAMSTPGHVWCRFDAGARMVDVETTSREWFALAEKYRGVPTSRVSPAMAKHRARLITGRRLDDERLLAVLHFNRGVTFIRENRLGPAAWANLQALALDPDCVPAAENLAAVFRKLPISDRGGELHDYLIRWAIQQALENRTSPLALRPAGIFP